MIGLGLLASLLGGIGSRLTGGAKGQADERTNQNAFTTAQNSQIANLYGTQQNATLNALSGQDRGALDRYTTQQRSLLDALLGGSNEATSRYGTQQGATSRALEGESAEGLARSRLGLDSGSTRARQSILGSIMQNGHALNLTPVGGVAGHVPQISGGLSLDTLSPESRQHGQALTNAALMAQLSGSDVPAATNFRAGILSPPAATDFKSGVMTPPDELDWAGGVLAPPTLTGYKGAGKGESILSLLGMLLGGASDVSKSIQGNRYNPMNEEGGG